MKRETNVVSWLEKAQNGWQFKRWETVENEGHFIGNKISSRGSKVDGWRN